MESNGTPTISETLLPMNVTKGPSHSSQHASLDVTHWSAILSHPVVLQQGTLSPTATRGTILFSLPTSPRSLKSDKQKSILCHLSEMFTQWNGTLVFELVFTLPIFVTTKIIFSFVPWPYQAAGFTVGMLAGLQNSVIANPANESKVVLRVPFISSTNWLGTADRTGEICAALLEPLVFSMDFKGQIPWTLFVSADPSDFNFRYIMPPLLEILAPDTQTGLIEFQDTIMAVQCSTGYASAEDTRSSMSNALVQPRAASTARTFESLMMIPRSRVEFVMQKVRGQFPAGAFGTQVICTMFDVPPSSFTSYIPEGLTPLDIYPFANSKHAVAVRYWDEVNSSTLQCPPDYLGWPHVEIVEKVLSGGSGTGVLKGLCLRITQQQYDARVVPIGAQANFMPHSFLAGPTSPIRFSLEKYHTESGFYYHCWLSTSSSTRRASGTTTEPGLLMCWVRDPPIERICGYLRQIDSAPAEVTHLALYTTLPPEQAATFCNWLTTQDNTSPPSFILSHSISFSTCQAPLSFNESRLALPSTRGIVWRLFKLFRGDESKWYAWLVKALDVVVDALIGTFLGRADSSQVVPIGRGSPIRLVPCGPYDASLVSSYTDKVALEPIVPQPGESLLQISARNLRGSETSHHFLRHRSKTPQTDPALSSDNPLAPPSRRNRRWRAQHPSSSSSKRRSFRASKTPSPANV